MACFRGPRKGAGSTLSQRWRRRSGLSTRNGCWPSTEGASPQASLIRIEQTFAIVRSMLGDISTPEAVERERRSVTMLSPGAAAYSREEALSILEALAAALDRAARRGRACQ